MNSGTWSIESIKRSTDDMDPSMEWMKLSAPLQAGRFAGVPQLWFKLADTTVPRPPPYTFFRVLAATIVALAEQDVFHLVEPGRSVYQLTFSLEDLFMPREPSEASYCDVRAGLFNLHCGAMMGWQRNKQWCVTDQSTWAEVCLPDTPVQSFDFLNPVANCELQQLKPLCSAPSQHTPNSTVWFLRTVCCCEPWTQTVFPRTC